MTFSELADSVVQFVSTAAEKMRKQRLTASSVSVFIETNRFKEKGQYANSATLKIQPTDSTLELIPYVLRILDRIFKPGYGYRKSGVLLLGLTPVEGETKRLYNDDDYQADRKLMEVIDTVNAKHGRNTIRFGLPAKKNFRWKMNRNFLSDDYTTSIADVLRVRM